MEELLRELWVQKTIIRARESKQEEGRGGGELKGISTKCRVVDEGRVETHSGRRSSPRGSDPAQSRASKSEGGDVRSGGRPGQGPVLHGKLAQREAMQWRLDRGAAADPESLRPGLRMQA